MVSVTVKPKDFSKAAQKLIEQQTKKDMNRFIPKAIDLMKAEITESILFRGVSPVSLQGKYQAYSKSYKKQIRSGKGKFANKDIRPVNLFLTGKLLKSIKGRPVRNGFSLWFSDKKAKWHDNEGVGKSEVIRRMLPNDAEKFNQVITRELDKLFKKSF